MKNNHRTWVEIDSHAFNHNINQLKNLIGNTALGIVVKADAYGHGLELIGRLCQENSYVSWLFTAGLNEAVRLRESGVTKPILVLAYPDDELDYLINYTITYAVSDRATLCKLSELAKKFNKTVSIHLKIDTGMCRLGFKPDHASLSEIIGLLAASPELSLEGILTHLSDTNNSDYFFTKNQLQKFNETRVFIEKAAKKPLLSHAFASGALHLVAEYGYDCVRVGTNAYGYWKSPLQQQRLMGLAQSIQLRPVLAWKTRIIDIKQANAGDAVGYHRSFIATGPITIAILPVGYYDGYPRGLSHKASVLVRGTYAPIIGLISMNLMMVDVSSIGSVRICDEVLLCGDYPGITAHDLSVVTDSLHLEFLTRISSRIPRVVI